MEHYKKNKKSYAKSIAGAALLGLGALVSGCQSTRTFTHQEGVNNGAQYLSAQAEQNKQLSEQGFSRNSYQVPSKLASQLETIIDTPGERFSVTSFSSYDPDPSKKEVNMLDGYTVNIITTNKDSREPFLFEHNVYDSDKVLISNEHKDVVAGLVDKNQLNVSDTRYAAFNNVMDRDAVQNAIYGAGAAVATGMLTEPKYGVIQLVGTAITGHFTNTFKPNRVSEDDQLSINTYSGPSIEPILSRMEANGHIRPLSKIAKIDENAYVLVTGSGKDFLSDFEHSENVDILPFTINDDGKYVEPTRTGEPRIGTGISFSSDEKEFNMFAAGAFLTTAATSLTYSGSDSSSSNPGDNGGGNNPPDIQVIGGPGGIGQ